MKSINDSIAELSAIVKDKAAAEPYIEGHGIQSCRFRFSWSDDVLSMDFDLPCCRILSDEEEQRSDDEEIAAACRMGMLLLLAREGGTLLTEGEDRLEVSCDEDGIHYLIRDPDGATLDEGDDWNILTARLESAMPDSGSVSIIMP